MTWNQCKCKCHQNGIFHCDINLPDYENLAQSWIPDMIYFVHYGTYDTSGDFQETGDGAIYRNGIKFCLDDDDWLLPTSEFLKKYYPDYNESGTIDASDASLQLIALREYFEGDDLAALLKTGKKGAWSILNNHDKMEASFILDFAANYGAGCLGDPKGSDWPNIKNVETNQYTGYRIWLSYPENQSLVNYTLFTLLDEAIDNIEDNSQREDLWKFLARTYVNMMTKLEGYSFRDWLEAEGKAENYDELIKEVLAARASSDGKYKGMDIFYYENLKKLIEKEFFEKGHPFLARHKNWDKILNPSSSN